VSSPLEAGQAVAREALKAAVPDQYDALVGIVLDLVTLGIGAALEAHEQRAVEIETTGPVTLVGDW